MYDFVMYFEEFWHYSIKNKQIIRIILKIN